jgi:hypothetical protein
MILPERITMNFALKIRRLIAGRWWLTAASLTLTLGLHAWGGDLQLPLLRTKTGNFTNVTVMGMSKTDIFIRHSRGIGNIKLIHLDSETLRRLGLGATTSKDGTSSTVALRLEPVAGAVKETLARAKTLPRPDLSAVLSWIRPTPNIVTFVVALVLGLYLFFCRCLKVICEKAGQPPGGMIWIPGLQMFPLLRAAGMSGWWFLAFLIPVINLIAAIVWSFKIVQARGKSGWVAVFLSLPLINLFAIVYLAFSGDDDTPEGTLLLNVAKPSAALGEA